MLTEITYRKSQATGAQPGISQYSGSLARDGQQWRGDVMVGTSEQKTETTNGTWNGVEGWGQVVLDHTVIEMQSGFACSRKYSVSDGLPHLRPFNIGTDGEINLGEIINIPKDYRGDLSHYELVPGDVLFNNTNSVELVGKTAIVHDLLTCAFSNHLTRLRIRDKTRLEPAWLALCLRLLWKRGFFEQHCNKWIGQAGFNPTKLANVEIPLPHVDIQRRIVARIEALMAEMNRARELLDQMHQGVSLLIDAALGEVFNDSKIDEWTNKSKLGDLVAIHANQVDPRQPNNKLLPHVGVDVIESATCRIGKY
jgi:type I restriction enzyme S subunit